MKLRKLSPDLQEKAIKELNENPKRVEDDIKHLKTWLSKQQHIRARTDEQWLLAFLRGSKFSLERAKEKLDMFYTMRTVVPEILKNRDPLRPEIQDVLDLGVFLPLPHTTPEGETVVMIQGTGYDPSKTELANIFKVQTMIVDILLIENDNFVTGGVHAVVDLKGATMGHLAGLTPMLIKKILKIFQHAYPLRPKGLIYINMPSFFGLIMDLVKSLLTDKLKKRLYMFTDDKIELKSVPISLLPKEYGGTEGTMKEIAAHWKKKVESYRSWFLEEENYGTDEKKRPGKPKTSENIFGVDGSFRKLEVD